MQSRNFLCQNRKKIQRACSNRLGYKKRMCFIVLASLSAQQKLRVRKALASCFSFLSRVLIKTYCCGNGMCSTMGKDTNGEVFLGKNGIVSRRFLHINCKLTNEEAGFT